MVAIEPEPRNVATLRRRVGRAGLAGVVECVHAAAADRSGELRLAVDRAHPWWSSPCGGRASRPRGDDRPDHRGDSRRVSLLKIDVQGAEKLVLVGARHVIETHRPAVFVELDDAALEQFGSSGAELIEAFGRLGYSGHTLTRRGIVAAEPPETLAAKSADSYIDVLFLPEPARADR